VRWPRVLRVRGIVGVEGTRGHQFQAVRRDAQCSFRLWERFRLSPSAAGEAGDSPLTNSICCEDEPHHCTGGERRRLGDRVELQERHLWMLDSVYGYGAAPGPAFQLRHEGLRRPGPTP